MCLRGKDNDTRAGLHIRGGTLHVHLFLPLYVSSLSSSWDIIIVKQFCLFTNTQLYVNNNNKITQ